MSLWQRSLLFNLLYCNSNFSWDDMQQARVLFWDHEWKELHHLLFFEELLEFVKLLSDSSLCPLSLRLLRFK